ncbi:MAG: hypothetical protein ACUZ8H_10395 [Candidatus Anammoxibacter sp.]
MTNDQPGCGLVSTLKKMNVLKRKKMFFTIHILLIGVFSLASVHMCLYALNPVSDNTGKPSDASAMGEDCRCDMTKAKSSDCCCASPTLAIETVQIAVNNSGSKFFNAIISSLKCSSNSDYFYNNSLTDYEPIPINAFILHLNKNGSVVHLKESPFLDPHLLLQFKPPKYIS